MCVKLQEITHLCVKLHEINLTQFCVKLHKITHFCVIKGKHSSVLYLCNFNTIGVLTHLTHNNVLNSSTQNDVSKQHNLCCPYLDTRMC